MEFTISKNYNKLDLIQGDIITHINGEPFIDIIDFTYFLAESAVYLTVKRGTKVFKTQKFAGAELLVLPLGNDFMPELTKCNNNCVFCFVNQLPKNMRRSLYVKDDDWRHSLLYGNYITLANTPENELKRIVSRSAQPLYISVHTVDEEKRKYILGNKNAADIKPILEYFYKNKISFHAQIVLLKGINDGETLKQTIEYLYFMHPVCLSLAVVPVGLSAHRDYLPKIEEIDSKTAYEAIQIIEEYARSKYFETKNRFVYASDELYIKAGLDIPDFQAYDDFPQIENGVGLIAKFLDDTDFAIQNIEGELMYQRISFATGEDFYPFLCTAAEKLSKFFGIDINIYKIENLFFGGGVTVSGLITGQDIAVQLKGQDLGEILYLTPSMLNNDDVFLDDMDIETLSKKLGIAVESSNIENLPFLRRADE